MIPTRSIQTAPAPAQALSAVVLYAQPAVAEVALQLLDDEAIAVTPICADKASTKRASIGWVVHEPTRQPQTQAWWKRLTSIVSKSSAFALHMQELGLPVDRPLLHQARQSPTHTLVVIHGPAPFVKRLLPQLMSTDFVDVDLFENVD